MILTINNIRHELNVDADTTLLSVLRDELDMTGSKYGCGEGACGACTVHIDGVAVRSCTIKASTLIEKSVTTIEGLGSKEKLHPVQQAFLKADPLQCAYCATGMIMSAAALLAQKPSPSTADINQAMNGNICRCGTYPNIVKAIKLASTISSAK
jgi:nicotinate dehydrogenase subunit A